MFEPFDFHFIEEARNVLKFNKNQLLSFLSKLGMSIDFYICSSNQTGKNSDFFFFSSSQQQWVAIAL